VNLDFGNLVGREPFEYAVAGGALLVAAICAVVAFYASRERHRILDTPTVPTGRLFIGVMEVFGGARPAPWRSSIRSPLDGTECVWWSIDVQRREKTKNSTSWITEDSIQSNNWIGVDDGSGLAVVCLAGASPNRLSQQIFDVEDLAEHLTETDLRARAAEQEELGTDPNISKTRRFLELVTSSYNLDVELRNLGGTRRLVEYSIPLNAELYVRGRTQFDNDLHHAVFHNPNQPVVTFCGTEKRLLLYRAVKT
jgi:hypothetical protein